MNYLDAWVIVKEYIDFFAQGRNKWSHVSSWEIFSFAKGLNEKEWKEKLIKASCIYWCHVIFWETREPEQLDTYTGLLRTCGKDFVSAQRAKVINDAWEIIEKSVKSKIYKFFNRQKVELAGHLYAAQYPDVTEKFDENEMWANTINHMSRYKYQLEERFEIDTTDAYNVDMVKAYCSEIYRVMNIPEPENAWVYFWTFDDMRRNLENLSLRPYYIKYARILQNYQQ